MRKEDLTVPALLLEAIGIIISIAYIGLQIFYGIYYHIAVYKYVMNILVLLLVYSGFTMLSMYPEKLNRLPQELCQGYVRKYSLMMIRGVKFVFVAGLCIPCAFDVAGIEIQSAYSLIVMGIIILIAVYCEYRIIQELKNMNDD